MARTLCVLLFLKRLLPYLAAFLWWAGGLLWKFVVWPLLRKSVIWVGNRIAPPAGPPSSSSTMPPTSSSILTQAPPPRTESPSPLDTTPPPESSCAYIWHKFVVVIIAVILITIVYWQWSNHPQGTTRGIEGANKTTEPETGAGRTKPAEMAEPGRESSTGGSPSEAARSLDSKSQDLPGHDGDIRRGDEESDTTSRGPQEGGSQDEVDRSLVDRIVAHIFS